MVARAVSEEKNYLNCGFSYTRSVELHKKNVWSSVRGKTPDEDQVENVISNMQQFNLFSAHNDAIFRRGD